MRLLQVVVCVLFAVCQTGFAVEVGGLYDAEVKVAGPTPEERNAAIGKALGEVLGRLLPAGELATNGARKVLDGAAGYVRQYRYVMEGEAERKLSVQFDPAMLVDALRANGLGVWEASRPELLVWLAMEENGKWEIFSAEAMPEMNTALKQAAARKGLPLLLPLMDLADRRQLSADAVRQSDAERINRASGRYQVDNILAGSLSPVDGGRWQAQWRLVRSDGEARWQGEYDTLPEALQDGMNGVYDRLVERHAVKMAAGGASSLDLKVEGIANLAEFSRVSRYLEGLSIVETVTWLKVEEGGASFRVRLKGDAGAFRQVLASGSVLEPMGNAESGVLTCRIVPSFSAPQ